jgi:acyl-CoA synthetase (AMP-forming)/AMP-acid ligase II
MSGVPLHSIRDVWYHNLEKFPRKVAAICDGVGHGYAECDLLSDRLRRHLAERFGFRKGEKLAIAGPNCFEYYIAYWAVIKSGGVVVPVNIRLGRDEMEHILATSDAETLVVHRSNWRTVKEALTARTQIKHVIGIGFSDDGATTYESLVADGGAYDAHPEIGEDDLAIILHTSGTTGRPKGAMMRHGDLLFNNRTAVFAHSLRHEDLHLLVVPMFHATACYSLLPTSALLGSTLVLAPRNEVGYLAELIQAHRVTVFFGVPAMFRLLTMMPDLEKYDLRSLHVIAYAGAPMPPAVIRRLREIFPGVMLHNFFGLTETTSMTHVLPSADADLRPESIGKLLPQVSQRILDAEGREAPPGQVGELYFHRANVIPGYWKDPGRLEQAMKGDWFNTGDLALVDEEGYVYLKGRSKDMIIVGGENVYALEVENCILTHEKVMDAAVVGIPATGIRAHLGELVKAVIVPRPGSNLTEAEVKRHCMERLATYKVPQLIEFRTELPRNTGGKVMKNLLKG